MDDKYIQLLKFGRDNLGGVKYSNLQEKMKELGLPAEPDGMQGTLNGFVRDIFQSDGGNFRLTFLAYFQLHEHERLEEARIESKKATRIATWSIWLTVFFILVSSVIGLLQYCK